jgi:UDP-glucose:(heptosyl)LPS alpha-1,3-glucosyltransferase
MGGHQQQKLLSKISPRLKFLAVMKIRVIIGKFSQYGGAESIAFRFSKFLYQSGLLEEVLCFKREESGFSGKVVELPVLKLGRFLKAYSFNYLVNKYLKEKENQNIVNFSFNRVQNCHVFRAGGGTHLGFLKKSIEAYRGSDRIKKRFTRFLNPINVYMPTLEKKVLLSSKRIIAVSEQVKEEIKEYYGDTLQRKVSVIPNSVDTIKFNSNYRKLNKQRLRKNLNISKEIFVVGFASSNFKLKGLNYIIEALKKLPNNVHLIVAGGRNPRKYLKLAENLKVRERVHFLGKIKRMEDFYTIIDCLAHPSFYDSFGNVVTEALSMHVPVIVSKNTGSKDFVVSGKNGFLLNAINSNELAKCIMKTMNFKPDFSANKFLDDKEMFQLYVKEAEKSLLIK